MIKLVWSILLYRLKKSTPHKLVNSELVSTNCTMWKNKVWLLGKLRARVLRPSWTSENCPRVTWKIESMRFNCYSLVLKKIQFWMEFTEQISLVDILTNSENWICKLINHFMSRGFLFPCFFFIFWEGGRGWLLEVRACVN